MARLILSIELAPDARISAGDIRLLELVDTTGSITAAGRAYGVTYRRAWTLLDGVNRMFSIPVLDARKGGRDGGGARLTSFGRQVVARYRAIEQDAATAVARDLHAFDGSTRPA